MYYPQDQNPHVVQGTKLMSEGQKKWEGSTNCIRFNRAEKELEMKKEACDCYEAAGRSFYWGHSWHRAGLAYEEAGKKWRSIGEYGLAGKALEDAVKYFKLSNDSQRALDTLEEMIGLYIGLGDFLTVASCQTKIADMLKSTPEYEKAISFYGDASSIFREQKCPIHASDTMVEAANLIAEKRDEMDEAIPIYEEVMDYLKSSGPYYDNIKQIIYKKLICHLNEDVASMDQALKNCSLMLTTFTNTRYYRFIQDLSLMIQSRDKNGYDKVVRDFQTRVILYDWSLNLLHRAIDKAMKIPVSES